MDIPQETIIALIVGLAGVISYLFKKHINSLEERLDELSETLVKERTSTKELLQKIGLLEAENQHLQEQVDVMQLELNRERAGQSFL